LGAWQLNGSHPVGKEIPEDTEKMLKESVVAATEM